jgi:hypothetical protein
VGERTGLLGQPGGRRALRRCRRRWENIIKVDLKEIELKGLDWIHLSQDREQLMSLLDNVIKSIKKTAPYGGNKLDEM